MAFFIILLHPPRCYYYIITVVFFFKICNNKSKMPQQPESSTSTTTSPLHLLQSCLLANKETTQCLNDESPIHCFWNVLQSRITSSANNGVSSSSLGTAQTYTPSRAEMRNAHEAMRQDWNLSSLIWNNGDAASFRG